ncbi:MAG: sensor histidine kinase [Planctomycetota bacterium]
MQAPDAEGGHGNPADWPKAAVAPHLFHATIDALPSNIAILDRGGVIRFTNRAWDQFAAANGAATSNGYRGVDYIAVCDAAVGLDRDLARDFAAGLRALSAGQRCRHALEYPCHSDDEQRWFIGRAAALNVAGERYVVVAHENITARKLSELRAQHLNNVLRAFRGIGRSIVHIDDPRRLLRDACDQLTRNRGYRGAWMHISGGAELGAPLFHEAGYGQAAENVARELRQGEPPPCCALADRAEGGLVTLTGDTACTNCPIHLVSRACCAKVAVLRYDDHVYGHLEVSLAEPFAPLPEEDDLLAEIAADLAYALHNLAATRRLRDSEARFRQLAADLERSNADLQQFAYAASHDLQEPLRTITGFIRLLREEHASYRCDSSAGEYLGFIDEGAQRMLRLIQGLLRYSRVATHAADHHGVDLNAVRDQVLDGLASLIRETDARITSAPLPTVHADPEQMEQLLQNLIQNAIKFHRPGQRPQVELDAHRQSAGWRVTVRDHGIGVDPERADEVFTIFRRLHAAEDYPGTGIGLALCQRIVERHGGSIGVEVPDDGAGGARFYWYLPDPPAAPEN